jgi:hypothetical protein
MVWHTAENEGRCNEDWWKGIPRPTQAGPKTVNHDRFLTTMHGRISSLDRQRQEVKEANDFLQTVSRSYLIEQELDVYVDVLREYEKCREEKVVRESVS